MNDSDVTQKEIMEATHRALRKRGYPATTISKIADEFGKSRGLLYYHYEDKEDLLEDFLQYLISKLETRLASVERDHPHAHLREILDELLPSSMTEEQFRLRRALLEIYDLLSTSNVG